MVTLNTQDAPVPDYEYPAEAELGPVTTRRTRGIRLPVIRPAVVPSAMPVAYPDIVVVGQQPQTFQLTTTQLLIGAVILYLLLKN